MTDKKEITMSLPTTMRAVQYDKFGGSDLLTINEVPVPSPRPGQVLVRVQAFSVNRIDVIVREGEMRLFTGKRFPKGTGVDALGEVVSVGTGVMDYKVGDIVWGFNGSISMSPTGTAAEYALFRENRISHAPRIQNQIDAAALPLVSLAALQVLRKNLKLQAGQRLLVVGASGGVGHAALQIGQILGAQVATVSAEENIALCRELGSIEAYDHEVLPDPEKIEKFDAILDCGGVVTAFYRNYLKPGGRMMTVSPDGLPAVLTSLFTNRRVGFLLATKASSEAMKWITNAVERGQLRPVIEKKYSLEELGAAQDRVAEKHTRGKLVVVM